MGAISGRGISVDRVAGQGDDSIEGRGKYLKCAADGPALADALQRSVQLEVAEAHGGSVSVESEVGCGGAGR